MTVAVTTPSDREVVVKRAFNAPRDMVWDAHVKPELLRRWMLGPPGWEMPVCEVDLRVGGRYRHVWTNEATGGRLAMGGVYTEVSPTTQFAAIERFEGDELGPGAEVTQTFVEQGARTTVTVKMVFPSKEIRDQAVATGMTDGMEMGYQRLDDMFSETVGGRP